MKRSLRDAWCAALRSGDYKKTTGAFIIGPNSHICYTDTEAFCCLGVLCKVAGVPIEIHDEGRGVVGNWFFVQKAIGPLYQSLYRMNDESEGTRYSFADIADFIETDVSIDEENPLQ